VCGLLESSIGRFAREDESSGACSCYVSFDEETLVLDASDCDGQLATSTACRRTVIDALTDRDASRIVVRNTGLEQQYRGSGVELLCSAGRFIERLGDRNNRLAMAALGDPLGSPTRWTRESVQWLISVSTLDLHVLRGRSIATRTRFRRPLGSRSATTVSSRRSTTMLGSGTFDRSRRKRRPNIHETRWCATLYARRHRSLADERRRTDTSSMATRRSPKELSRATVSHPEHSSR